ncbi:hypothetical protein P5763_07255 [Bacillus cereus]|uniref:hypothetical protein n=1 Tax=Bacillus cereus TaxID=1396 RepID=UPI002405EE56|nr:hypothetical protein [Bacillus cereus]MDF9611869.1 hypothetical protein [Bacillus cereus]
MGKIKSLDTAEPTSFYHKTEYDGDGWMINADSDGELFLGIYKRDALVFEIENNTSQESPEGSLILNITEAKKLRKHLNKAIRESEYRKVNNVFREEN